MTSFDVIMDKHLKYKILHCVQKKYQSKTMKKKNHKSSSHTHSFFFFIRRASRRWSQLSENEKKPWHGLAEQEKLAHREAFPEYRYCPRRATPSSPIKRPIKETMDEDDCSKKSVKRKTK